MNQMIQKPRWKYFLTLPVLAGLMLTWAFAGQSPLAAGTSDSNPEARPQAALTGFYHWYLQSLTQHHNPLGDEPAKMRGYVSKKLLQQINKRANSPEGLDEDYFTQAQDYFEDWPTHIAVSDMRMKGGTASALVTLGATKDSKHRLAVDLVLEGASWKISKVRESVGP